MLLSHVCRENQVQIVCALVDWQIEYSKKLHVVGISEWFAGSEMKKWKETKRNQRKLIDFKSEQKAKKTRQMERNAGKKQIHGKWR